MMIDAATILRSPVDQNAQHGQIVRLEEGQYFIVEHNVKMMQGMMGGDAKGGKMDGDIKGM